MRSFKFASVVAFALAHLACGESVADSLAMAQQAIVVPPSWTCSTYSAYLGRNLGDLSYSITNPPASTQTFSPIDAAGRSITLSSADGIHFDWTSTALIRAIFIRADVSGTALGDATNELWLYATPSGGGAYSGAGVYTQDSANTVYPAKQIEFCFDAPPTYQLEVSKTAKMSYEKKFEWYLFKTTDPAIPSLTLSTGQVIDVGYLVAFGVNGILTDKYAVAGQILIHNPAPIAAMIISISDAMSGATDGSLDCGVMLPYSLAAGASLTCNYEFTLLNGDDVLDTATVVTTGAVSGGDATATAYNSNADVTLIDPCVTVTDDHLGLLRTACWDEGAIESRYTLRIGPFDVCGGPYAFTNVATLTTSTTQQTLTAPVTIPITVPCVGCTLTPGYWRTHSKYGPAPYDDTWALFDEDLAFFLSGLTRHGQFLVPPAGNAYFQLSHQYAAAVLNSLNGASTSAVVAAMMADAKSLLELYTPEYVAGLRGGSALRARFVGLAEALARYNTGEIGPGHCSE